MIYIDFKKNEGPRMCPICQADLAQWNDYIQAYQCFRCGFDSRFNIIYNCKEDEDGRV